MDVLCVAVAWEDTEAVKLLRITGIDLSAPITARLGRHEPRKIICTLLHQAVQHQSSHMFTYLQNFINSDTVDARCRTPLHYAVEYKHAQKRITELRSSGANISSQDEQGWTPLHMASRYDISESVINLLDAGAHVDVLDDLGMTPLHHCAFSFKWTQQYPSPAMLLLIEAGASSSSLNNDGYTPLQLALITSIRTHSPSYLSSVLGQQTDLISVQLPPLDRTALHFAAEANCGSSILKILLLRKADLEAEDKDGKTPVQLAGKETHQLLINHGARWKK